MENVVGRSNKLDPFHHCIGVGVIFQDEKPPTDYLRYQANSFTEEFKRSVTSGHDFLHDDPNDEWFIHLEHLNKDDSSVYMKIARLEVQYALPILKEVAQNKDDVYTFATVSRAQQMLSDMSSLDPSTVINISYVGESVEVLLRWESTYPLIIQILMERAEEVGGSSFCGAIAQYPQGNKRDCLFGESMTLAIIQDSIGTKNLHVGMFNFNLVPGGPRLHNKSRLDGHRLVKYLISNSSLFVSTPILDVPGLPKNILEMATLHAVQIADYLHISLIDMNRLTLKQFHRWFSHVCIIKAFREGSRAAAIKANHAAKIAEHFGCDVSEVPNLTDRQIYSYVGKYYHPKEAVRELKKWYDKHESHPYPSKEEKEELASTTMLTEKQIKTWFKVERAKRKKAVSEHKEAVRKLREWYEENDSHPYPSKEEKEELASTTKLTEKQINQWFVRERLKRKKAAGETIASFERLPTETVDKLRKWYEENESNHYPSKEEREEFARTTGLTENKIRNWFMSERARRK